MKILHTSDWHIGRNLYGRKRYEEFASFLTWLVETISLNSIDVLIVAGDIFDTGTPSNKAQRLYYQFLKEVSSTCCRHIIIIGGNHDSPTLLEAPKELLRFFDVHVIGSAQENLEDEVIILKSTEGEDELIVCAVPYLRDRDIRSANAGEDIDDKNRKLLNGIENHYKQVAEIAIHNQLQSAFNPPIIATGHLFAAGGTKVEGDGVRDLYVGSLVYVNSSTFPACFKYLALGHLHSSQIVGKNPAHRYSGSPLPMSFNEAEKTKKVLLVEIENEETKIHEITVPRFQKLQSVRGDMEYILSTIELLILQNTPIWLEVIYDGEEIITNLQSTLAEAIDGSAVEILRIVNNRLMRSVMQQNTLEETLETMTQENVFERCLESQNIPQNQHGELIHLFRETVQAIEDEDLRAE